MAENHFQGIEIRPRSGPAKQLFVLLHGVGSSPPELVPLANKISAAFPNAALLLPEGTFPFDGGGKGRQWFSIRGITEENRILRVADALPTLHALVREAQNRFNILQSDTALIGFSQGAIMALEFAVMYDGRVGRVLAFSGRFAKLPEKAPEWTTVHLLHGEADPIIAVEHAHAAFGRLMALSGDATLDLASSVGHEIHPLLAERAILRLQTCIPLRSWKNALSAA